MQAMDWDDLRFLLAISRAGSLAAAARRLSVNQTTVARRLARAEAALKAKLFQRLGGALQPTAAGRAALARASRMEQELDGLELGLSAETEPAGVVRVTAVPILVNRLLVPAVADLLRRHPRLRLELIADSRNADLSRHQADLALRLARPEGAGPHLARRLGTVAYAVYGRRDGAGKDRRWVTYEEGSRHLPQARWMARASRGKNLAAMRVSDSETVLQAVRAGLGRSLLPCFVADGDRDLRRLGPRAAVLGRELWLLSHRDQRHTPAVAAVVDWLARTTSLLSKKGDL